MTHFTDYQGGAPLTRLQIAAILAADAVGVVLIWAVFSVIWMVTP